MTGTTLLVDPLAALFRPALEGRAPLLLDKTEVEVTLVPPMAHIVVTRQFTNTTEQLVEAVLTLPPLAPQEVVFRLTVCFGGRLYEAIPQPAKRARHAHDDAIAQGRVAILYELLRNDVQLISIAGIKPGAQVKVQTWSIRPLVRPEENRATLSITLGAARNFPGYGLSDADAPVITTAYHSGTLMLNAAETLQVTHRPWNDLPEAVTSPEPVIIDCGIPILLDIVALEGGRLDHSEWQVDKPGGWEASAVRIADTLRGPMMPGQNVTSHRTDWIFGVTRTDDSEIRVTAPLPTEEIAPHARALRAFAAAGFVASATPLDVATVRRTANILSRQTSLVFIGPEGELPDELPMLRKLALPTMLASDGISADPQPPALEPFPVEPPPAPRPSLPIKSNPITPGSSLRDFDGKQINPGAMPPRSRLKWVKWVPAALVLLGIAVAFQSIDYPMPPKLMAIVGLMLLSAIPFVPREGSPARRRLPLLTILPLPWIVSLLAGPLTDDFTYGGGAPVPGWMIPLQYALLAASALLPVFLIPIMREARRFTAVLGVLNFVLTFFVTSASILILTPGS
jgi:hypothetical protein